jgi:hypothetical protein
MFGTSLNPKKRIEDDGQYETSEMETQSCSVETVYLMENPKLGCLLIIEGVSLDDMIYDDHSLPSSR